MSAEETTSTIICQIDKELPTPKYQTSGSVGVDLYCSVDVRLIPGERAAIPTGISLQLPPLMEGQIRSRSGLANGHGVCVLNAPGTIDSDYRGEIMVLLINHGYHVWECKRGTRIAQLVFAPVFCIPECMHLDSIVRGASGLGSTGER
jgi:dUTP pyrophosphatase